jgi:hypothetical protein
MSFNERLRDAALVHGAKQTDYGTDEDPYANYRSSEDYGIPAWLNAHLRVREKANRVATAVRKGHLVNESLDDALRDIAVGGLIAWDLFIEATPEQDGDESWAVEGGALTTMEEGGGSPNGPDVP